MHESNVCVSISCFLQAMDNHLLCKHNSGTAKLSGEYDVLSNIWIGCCEISRLYKKESKPKQFGLYTLTTNKHS